MNFTLSVTLCFILQAKTALCCPVWLTGRARRTYLIKMPWIHLPSFYSQETRGKKDHRSFSVVENIEKLDLKMCSRLLVQQSFREMQVCEQIIHLLNEVFNFRLIFIPSLFCKPNLSRYLKQIVLPPYSLGKENFPTCVHII